MKLYGYWRSTAAYRVRIALHLKQIAFESEAIHLIKNGGEQHNEQYAAINPNELVPCIVDGDFVLNQSLAIIDYLDNKYPDIPLYPNELKKKAKVQALSLDIASEIHPLNNLRVQQYLSSELEVNAEAKTAWVEHWMKIGFSAIEKNITQTSGLYCFGDEVTVADICLVAQVYNANRFEVNMNDYPIINKVVKNCNQLSAFIKAMPENQGDAV